MNQTGETWPPPPVRPEPESEADDDDWLTADDLRIDVTWREYAVIGFAVLWGQLALLAVVSHHHVPARTIKNALHHARTVLS